MQDTTSPDDPAQPTSRVLTIGPFDQRPAGELAAHLADVAQGFRVPDWRERRAAWLRACLLRAGVELWAWDDHVLEAVASWEPETVHAIGAWVLRAGGVAEDGAPAA